MSKNEAFEEKAKRCLSLMRRTQKEYDAAKLAFGYDDTMPDWLTDEEKGEWEPPIPHPAIRPAMAAAETARLDYGRVMNAWKAHDESAWAAFLKQEDEW